MKQGLIYMAWGANAIAQAKQSMASAWQFMPALAVMVVGDAETGAAFEDAEHVYFKLCEINPFDENQKKGLHVFGRENQTSPGSNE